MTIDVEASFRKGSKITVVTVSTDETTGEPVFVRDTTDYGSINKAKLANRQTQYRVVPTGEKKKLNGVSSDAIIVDDTFGQVPS
jgi:hypothetical protein